MKTKLSLLVLIAFLFSCESKDNDDILDKQNSKLSDKITLTTTKPVGESLVFAINAAESDKSSVWIDLNNNGVKDSGEAVTKFGVEEDVSYNLGSSTISIYGKITMLYCYSNQLTSLDISKNTTLQMLDCNENKLTSLDVSKNTALTMLYCSYNQLSSLKLSKNTALTELWCDGNKLKSLDVSKNTALTMLSCPENELTSLDISANTALTMLDCNENQLTSLDVSKNMVLKIFYFYNNDINGANMTALVNSLHSNKYISDKRIVVKHKNNDKNKATVDDVKIATDKGWKVLLYDKKAVDYKGE